MFSLSAIEHTLDTFEALGEDDLSFGLADVNRAIGRYPKASKPKSNKGLKPKHRTAIDGTPTRAQVAT